VGPAYAHLLARQERRRDLTPECAAMLRYRITNRRGDSFLLTTHSRLHHHGIWPSSFENVPVGPFASSSARRTG
jgi:hypothetical protein